MVRRDHGGNNLADTIFAVVIGNVHKGMELNQELIHIKGNGFADMNALVGGFLQAFLIHQLFFIQLFTRAEAGILDFDIHIRLEAAEADQVTGKGIDFDGRAHIQDKDLAAFGIGAGLENEGDGFRNRHEIADDVWVRDRDRATFGNLFFENGNNRAVGAEDIAEPDGNKLCFRLFRLQGAILGGRELLDLIIRGKNGILPDHGGMGIELWESIGLMVCDFISEGLDYHLAQTFGGAHDVGWVDCLIRGDEDKTLAMIEHGSVGRFIGADGIVLDRLAGAVLHQGNMLMGCRMVDDVRAVGGKDLIKPAAVTHGADEGDKVEVRVLLPEFQLDVIGVIFIDIKDDELAGIMGCDLTADLAADRAAAARDEDGFAIEEGKDFVHVDFDGLTAQKVFNRDLPQAGDTDLVENELVHTGELLDLTPGLVADAEDITALLCRGRGNGKEDFIYFIFPDSGEDALTAADDFDILDIAIPLVGIIVNNGADFFFGFRTGTDNVTDDHLAG